MFFSKKSGRLLAPTDGKLLPLSAVADEAFSSGILGVGFAIEPTAGTLYAPASGRIESIAESKHAYTIQTADGLDLLVHVGIDTVSLHGDGFLPMTREGEGIRAGEVLARFDPERIRTQGYAATVVVVVTNREQLAGFSLSESKSTLGGESVALEYRLK